MYNNFLHKEKNETLYTTFTALYTNGSDYG